MLSDEGYKRPGKRLQDMAEQFVDDYPEALAIAESLRIGNSVTGFDESIKSRKMDAHFGLQCSRQTRRS